MTRARNPIASAVRKIVVTVVGTVVLLAGIVMLVTPGQGILTILLGLAILATEFYWAKRLLEHAKRQAGETVNRFRKKPAPSDSETSPSDREQDSETR